jgi:lipoprotein LprG
MSSARRRSLGRGAALRLAALVAVPVVALGGCSSSEGSGGEESPESVLTTAKEELDATSGVELALTTDALPAGVDGVVEATGTVTRAPAFKGNLKARANNLTADVPVVSVDRTVYAKLPFSTQFAEINPADYGAPDPALLMDPEVGISTWLTEATGLEAGEQVRDGDTVLTEYTGVVPGEVVAATIPSADEAGRFPTTFAVDDDDRLQRVEISGPFYGPGGEVDYTVQISTYDVEADISPPDLS